MEFTKEVLHNQPNTVISVFLAILVLLGIYIKLLITYQKYFNHKPFSTQKKKFF